MQGYLKSRFCLCPASISTPVPSKRLMEALASGCIPVVLSSFDAAAASLPFRTSIAWSEIAIFAGDLPCFVEHLEGSTANWLRGLVADDEANERRLGCMRRRGQQAFASMLSYGRRSSTNGGSNGGGSGGGGGIGGSGGGSGVVDALMHELDVTGKLKAPAVRLHYTISCFALGWLRTKLNANFDTLMDAFTSVFTAPSSFFLILVSSPVLLSGHA